MQKKMIAAIIIIILLLATIMAGQLLSEDNGIPRQNEIREQNEKYMATIDSLQKEIENLKAEKERLENDSLYKEYILRTRYGMSKKGEKVFQMVK